MNNLDLLSIGDSSLDAFIFPTESESLCQLNDKECYICFSYGDKIPVKDLEFSVGGNAANNSVGSSRLGVKSAAVLTLGGDEIGNQIVEALAKDGVDTTYVSRQKGKRSNYSLAINYSGERTIFTYKDEIDYVLPEKFPSTSWIYLTSMGDNFSDAYVKVADHIKGKSGVKLAFNPGSRQIRAGYEKMKDILRISYMVYVNRKEAEIITNFSDSKDKEKNLLDALIKLGPKVPVITDGVGGSYVFYEGKYYHSGVLPIDAYERTGAGDAFGSGCISALIQGKSIEEALLWGTVNSASVIGYIGAQKGLLKKDEIGTWLERAESCNVKVEEI
ncbi:MAG TPA: carbohydrate kinase family protein [Patescibacteria group bacterium]|nr:carbohydrate kinase family protein [Patescibacteria group bacterium]